MNKVIRVLSRIFPGGAPPNIVLKGLAIVGFLHFSTAFILSSFLWITGGQSIDLPYYKYHGLIWIILDNWQSYLLVLAPLSLIAYWRGRINALRMVQKKIRGLWIFFDISFAMSVLMILFITGNMIINGFLDSWKQVLMYPLIMLSYVLIGCIYGIVIGFPIYVLNLIWITMAKQTQK